MCYGIQKNSDTRKQKITDPGIKEKTNLAKQSTLPQRDDFQTRKDTRVYIAKLPSKVKTHGLLLLFFKALKKPKL